MTQNCSRESSGFSLFMDKKKRILFVDDDAMILQSLQRMLRPRRQEWEMGFVNNGQEALKAMKEQAYDVVVTDMRMPGMDGAQLLDEIKKQYPKTARIILSGQTGREAFVRGAGTAHRFLSKPCSAETSIKCLEDILLIQESFPQQGLTGIINQIGHLPSLPEAYRLLREKAESPHFSLEEAGAIISGDMSMTAKILQMANAALFGFTEKILTPVHAVQVLGLDVIQGLILSFCVFSEFEEKIAKEFSILRLWRHTLLVGEYSRKIMQAENAERKMESQAAMAGLLHDIGKPLLIASLPDQYREIQALVISQKIPHWEAEQKVLETTHAELGAYLLGLWGLPEPIVEAVAYHHFPSRCANKDFSPLTAAHVANILEHKMDSVQEFSHYAQIDESYLKELGLWNHLPEWEKKCGTKPDQS